MVFGSSCIAPLTLSRTSCAATSGSFSSRKLIITCETPSDEIERSSSMPLIVLTASSILSLTSVSICSGAAPGCTVVTTTVGKSTLGKRSTPSSVKAKAPTTVSERIRTLAKTGRLTQSAANHCMSHLLHSGAVGQASDVLGRDSFADLESLGNLDEIAADRLSGRDDPLFGFVASHHEHAAR